VDERSHTLQTSIPHLWDNRDYQFLNQVSDVRSLDLDDPNPIDQYDALVDGPSDHPSRNSGKVANDLVTIIDTSNALFEKGSGLRYARKASNPAASVSSTSSLLELEQMPYISLKPFSPRELPGSKHFLGRRYVLSALRTYPAMLLSNSDLPPFIHPYFGYGVAISDTSIRSRHSDLRPLRNCAIIVQWQSMKSEESTLYLWRTIKAEQERLLSEVRSVLKSLAD
jgi:hypothetical protein